MAISAQDLEALLREGFADADIRIEDLAGDGDHYRAVIRTDAFEGKSRVAQHQMVYAALKADGGRTPRTGPGHWPKDKALMPLARALTSAA